MALDGAGNKNSSQLKIRDVDRMILGVTKCTKSKYLTCKT